LNEKFVALIVRGPHDGLNRFTLNIIGCEPACAIRVHARAWLPHATVRRNAVFKDARRPSKRTLASESLCV